MRVSFCKGRLFSDFSGLYYIFLLLNDSVHAIIKWLSLKHKENVMNLEWKQCFRIGVTLFILYLCTIYWKVVMSMLGVALNSITPIIIGICLAYLINLLMGFFERSFFPNGFKGKVNQYERTICMILSVVITVGFVVLVIYMIIPELAKCITTFTEQLPSLINDVSQNKFVQKVVPKNTINTLKDMNWSTYMDKISKFLFTGIGGAVDTVASVASSVASVVFTILMGIIFSFYILTSKEKLISQVKRVSNVVFKEKITEKISGYIRVMDECFHSYIVGKLLDAVIIGVMCAVVMLICRMPYVAMISTLIGFTALIPVVGAYVGTIIGAFMMLTVSPFKALVFIIIILAVQLVEGNLIYPKIMGSSLGLPGIWVLAAVTIGGSTFGILGMLIGVPVFATVYKIAGEGVRKREIKKQE